MSLNVTHCMSRTHHTHTVTCVVTFTVIFYVEHRKTAITTRILSLVHELCLKQIHVTKRDLFYTDVKLFEVRVSCLPVCVSAIGASAYVSNVCVAWAKAHTPHILNRPSCLTHARALLACTISLTHTHPHTHTHVFTPHRTRASRMLC